MQRDRRRRHMKARGLTHVNVHAHDLEESVHFYQTLSGIQEIPAPEFPFPVRWLRVGELELHLLESKAAAPAGHHFGIDVDNFEPVYEKAREIGSQVAEGYFSGLYEMPDGAVQLYLRDPAGNMVEVDYPRATDLDATLAARLERLPTKDRHSAPARLYLR
jgi:catechol 2,3-dioxygenase-like lactoylglutathione lyase family enzyme